MSKQQVENKAAAANSTSKARSLSLPSSSSSFSSLSSHSRHIEVSVISFFAIDYAVSHLIFVYNDKKDYTFKDAGGVKEDLDESYVLVNKINGDDTDTDDSYVFVEGSNDDDTTEYVFVEV